MNYGKAHHSKRHQIRASRRAILSDARNCRGKGTQNRQIRTSSPRLYQATQERHIHHSFDRWQT